MTSELHSPDGCGNAKPVPKVGEGYCSLGLVCIVSHLTPAQDLDDGRGMSVARHRARYQEQIAYLVMHGIITMMSQSRRFFQCVWHVLERLNPSRRLEAGVYCQVDGFFHVHIRATEPVSAP